MEISASASENIKKLVETWWKTTNVELEANFGAEGIVDVETFLRVAKRLSALGYKPLPQTEKLNILLRNKVRLSLQNVGVVQQYCRDNVAFGKPLLAIKKNSVANAVSQEVLTEYNVSIKNRLETPLNYDRDNISECDSLLQQTFKDWATEPKAFRLIKRWSFRNKGVVFDLSMIRSTKKDREGNYKRVRKFLDYDLMASAPQYEIEVELIREEIESEEDALKKLSAAIGTVLKGIQNNNIIIKNSTIESVLRDYRSVTGTDQFRGVAPVTLLLENMNGDSKFNIRENYNVTDKADGLRVHGFVDSEGELFLIDMGMRVYKTGIVNRDLRKSLVDAELVTVDINNRPLNNLYLFDIYVYKGDDVSQKPFKSVDGPGRYEDMKAWVVSINEKKGEKADSLKIYTKNFYFHDPQRKVSIFQYANEIMSSPHLYYTDGLIFTPNEVGLPSRPSDGFKQQFKWKPAHENTIDFLVKYEKDAIIENSDKITTAIHPDTNETIRYKTMRLFVGSSRDSAFEDPRSTILNEIPIPTEQDEKKYKPTIFNPVEFPDTMASVCYLRTQIDPESGEEYCVTADTAEPIRDTSIVEMAYDGNQPPGWRWRPLIVRNDKTARYVSGQIFRTLNSAKTAESIWNSIHDPITEHMIETGDLQPSETEMKEIIKLGVTDELKRKYYYRKASQKDLKRVIGLRDFHKKYVKDQILFRVLADKDASTHKTLLDVAVGRAADIHRWIRGGLSFVLGVDLAGENIRTSDGGAYARYINIMSESEGRKLPTMVFTIGNSAQPLIDGSAGATPEESDMLRAVFGRVNPAGPVPPYIEKYGAGRMRDGTDVIACMFALHYFFETRQAFEGLMKNIDDTLKMGGYFIGACFDGLKVRELLAGKKRDEKVIGVDGDTELWSIKKEYDDKDIDSNNEDSMFGQALTVDFISIGSPHTEYLMHYNYLVRRLKEIGVEPLKEVEWKALGLNSTSELFSQTYDEAKKNNKNYVMSDAAKQFSFLNRWFIFKRNALAKPKEETAAAVESVAAVQGKPLAGQIVQIDADAPANDRYKLGVVDAASWLSPLSHFPIPDEDDPTAVYPSIEHYIMGMRFKIASSKPEYADAFTINGEIHQKYNGIKQTEKAAGNLDADRLMQLLKEESAELKKNLTAMALKKLKITIRDADWIEAKDDVLKYALKVRYTKDAKFKKAVDSAKAQGKYLLLYSASKTSDLGGRRLSDGTIEGDNKYGRFLMELAGF